MDQILITDLVANGIIGINDWESKTAQEMLINSVLFAYLYKAGESDDLHDDVDYREVPKRILVHAETAGRSTVEALAADLASLRLEETQVEKVRVRVEKPGAVRFSRFGGVEIERAKEDSFSGNNQ